MSYVKSTPGLSTVSNSPSEKGEGDSPPKGISPRKEELKWQLWEVQRVNCSASEEAMEKTDEHERRLGPLVANDVDFANCLNEFKFSKLSDDLRPHIAYAFFKEGIKPKVEDGDNYNGARFFFTKNDMKMEQLDQNWEQLCKHMMDETFGNKINGVRLSWVDDSEQKDKFEFQIWSRVANNETLKGLLAATIKSRLHLSDYPEYQSHVSKHLNEVEKSCSELMESVPILNPVDPPTGLGQAEDNANEDGLNVDKKNLDEKNLDEKNLDKKI